MGLKIPARIILTVWIIIWVLFLIRPFFKKDLMKDYAVLLTLSTEGKRAYCLGNELRRFINFCEGYIAGPFTYKIVGVEKDSLEHRRVKYYLYPNTEQADPGFILVYKVKYFSKKGYRLFKVMDSESCILEKTI
jgi:hypothetical protein